MGLLGAGCTVKCTEIVRDALGHVTSLVVSADISADRNKTKGHLHWVSATDGVRATVRVYSVLFDPEDPEAEAAKLAEAADGAEAGDEEGEAEAEEVATAEGTPAWLKLLNANSCTVHDALVEPQLAAAAASPNRSKDRPAFQFQRMGFFCVDTSSTIEKPVFNRVVALKEDKEKKTI